VHKNNKMPRGRTTTLARLGHGAILWCVARGSLIYCSLYCKRFWYRSSIFFLFIYSALAMKMSVSMEHRVWALLCLVTVPS